jgi:hypothetical protein
LERITRGYGTHLHIKNVITIVKKGQKEEEVVEEVRDACSCGLSIS